MRTLLRWVLFLLLGKEASSVAIIYATLIIKGRKTFAQVPAVIKEDVRQVLIDLDCEALAVE